MSYDTQKKKYSESDYLFGTARVRALEKGLLSSALIERMLDAPDEEGAIAVLREAGIEIDAADPEASLSAILKAAFDECTKMSADPRMIDILRLPYDAHNIKSALKCRIRGTDCEKLLSPIGTVPTEAIKKMPHSGDYSNLPANMAKAAKKAMDDYAANRDPQMLDAALDSACYADMTALAKEVGDPFFAEWVRRKIDMTNILTCVRIMRMTGEDTGLAYLDIMLIPGGTLDAEFFKSCLGDGETALWKNLSFSDRGSIVSRIETEGKYSLTFIEKICEDFCLEKAKTQKSVLASAGAVASYAIAADYMVKDIRIILAGKKAGTPTETVRERLRDTYV